MEIISAPLGGLMGLCVSLLRNYGLAIILFTLLTKVLLFPLSLWTHRNGIRMVRIEPEVNRLKIRYSGDKNILADETAALYRREHYSPFASVIPVAVQLLILFALVRIINHPAEDSGDMTFLGLNLMDVPQRAGGLSVLVPLLAAVASLALSLSQNRLNPLQASQSRLAQTATMAISVGISLFLGFAVPVGVGFYWIWSNLFSILQQPLLNRICPPERYIDYDALEQSRRELKEGTHHGKGEQRSRELILREKEDYRRFFSVGNKHLVFYSESSGFYKYYDRIIRYILDHSSMKIHYVTSDPDDQIFDMAKSEEKIEAYYIGEKKLISLFLKLEADAVVMTMSDLENYQYKRSYYRKDINYIYVFHYPLSTHMVLHTGALRHYDTILCVGEFQFEEIRQTEALFGDPPQKLIACGYGQLENLYDAYRRMPREKGGRPKVLIAPSWQPDNILDSCLDALLGELLGKGMDVTVRPHPEYVKRYGARMDEIVRRYRDYAGDDLHFELDFSGNTSIFASDTVISDWSGTAYEFAFVTERPCVFVDTPMKVNNPDYGRITVPPLEITLRDQVGIRLDPNRLEGAADRIRELLSDEAYGERIRAIREKYIAHFGHSGEVGGQAIIDAVKEQIQKRKEK